MLIFLVLSPSLGKLHLKGTQVEL
ncbi:hypothetical protein Ahy_B09g095783 isoform B [Arachis hypogaea]|uniref:Uncharacterized protein n=1 Tax=Arachis hypogaea TaxID=3818 RepID=A0A444XGD1_ARAHY|nr:hypothetical protein Ahy_B09g095783 isoform B [Arachis hypogaea]